MKQNPLLISVRDLDDPMVNHEIACFKSACGCDIDVVFAINSKLHLGLTDDRPALLFGGSGAYGVRCPDRWIQDLLDFMLLVVDEKVPSYASCFGFQGLALALGGEISSDPELQEMGIIPIDVSSADEDDPIFGALPSTILAPSGHNDHVKILPSGVTLVGRGDFVINQALKVDGAPFWASQFHPELTKATLIDRWNFYRDVFSTDPIEIVARDKLLSDSPETPHVGSLLSRLIEFGANR
jgi:GMP synthase (glutamine-hydrolysing)